MDHLARTSPNSAMTVELRLGLDGFTYPDLFDPHRLKDLYERFDLEIETRSPDLHRRWAVYRHAPESGHTPQQISDLLVEMGAQVSAFLVRLFRIEEEVGRLALATAEQDPVFRFKVDFVRRRVLPALKKAEPAGEPTLLDLQVAQLRDFAVSRRAASGPAEGVSGPAQAGHHEGPGSPHAVALADVELATALAGTVLLDLERDPSGSDLTPLRTALISYGLTPAGDQEVVSTWIELLTRWCVAHLHDPEYRDWASFRFANSVDYFNLVELHRPSERLPQLAIGPEEQLRHRDGFGLTDPRMGTREVLSEIHYCILCHERDKDSCSKGLLKDGAVTRNPLGIALQGCPLDEKISEMHLLRKQGDAIGALALVTLDNPLCPGTGHRICNDCMKSCIYQKQDPVNIPQIETGVLTDVLNLPWGVEIYGLLTRWNPLNVRRPYPLPYHGKKVLIVGLGPAGYTLAHHLLNEGFGVVGIDGLKIEPLPEELTGTEDRPPRAIRSWSELYTRLDERILEGFGGVSEYGITVRWDKNFLTLLHLTLARRTRLRMYGGVRFGGTITIEDAWNLGFDHIAIAAGAGRPTIIDMRNNLARGIRKASDFLMALQLTGAFKHDALANLQARLPALVIGGGLTAIDTATELAAYYPAQVEKALERYETLVATYGEAVVRAPFDEEERQILDEFLEHGRAVREERRAAAAGGRPPDFIRLVRGWGGVSIVYRKRLVDSPAYRLNHEEVVKSLQEGIAFIESLNPEEALLDAYGHVRGVRFRAQEVVDGRWRETDRLIELPARTALVAAGTTPNITYEKELPGTFRLDDWQRFFAPHRPVRDNGRWRLEAVSSDAAPPGFFTSYEENGRFISYYGDNHPIYAGNVVKAMASARDGYPHVVALFADELAGLDADRQPERDAAWQQFADGLDDLLIARVEEVRRLTPTIVEVIVRAPAAARRFHPGQFYRLQNYEALAATRNGTRLVMEGIALTGAWVDAERGLLSLIALEIGVSSRLCALLQPGEPVVVMGPTGAPTTIRSGERVLLAGGGLGNAVLFSIAHGMQARGNRVVYFAGYKRGEDLFKREEIESATDQVIWSTDTGAFIEPLRPQDRHFRGNIVQAMLAYGEGRLGEALVPLPEIDRIIAIGSDRMMAAVKDARHGVLAPFLRPDHVAIASINSPMQCMMKEVCAQCLQKHVDPVTGQETIIFSCFNQDQRMDVVDFSNLSDRLRQNTVQEKLSNLWLDYLNAGS
jgi:NADPH-dependent glutamate synthase beta subunit-like oxidoreductase/NAD(P)H-flavin reductase